MNAAFRIRSEETRYLAVGEHVVDVDTLRLVTTPGAPRLTPKAAAVLLQLVRAAGRTLSRDELLNEVWKGTCPTPDVLTQAVKDLRRLLGDDLHAPRFVETLPRLGYRLVAPARFIDDSTATAFAPGVKADVRAPDSARAARPYRTRRWVFAAATAATIAVLALGFRREQGDSAELKPRWHASAPRTITADPGPEHYPRISPDGTRVAYSIVDPVRHFSRIVQRSLTQPRLIGVTDGAAGNEFYPVWSPDGTAIAFARQDADECSILLASALGGAERLIDRCVVASVTYFSWTPDGRSLISTRPSSATATDMAMTLVPIDGSALDRIPYEHDNTDLDLDARYSPDGRLIAFRRGASPYSDLFVVDAIGGEVRQLTHLASRLRGFDWTRDGSALVFSSSHEGPQGLYTVSIADGRIESLGVQPAEYPSAARGSDTVVYEIPRLRTQLATVPLGSADAASEPEPLAPSTGNDGAPTFSPVDGRVAFVSDRGGAQQVWLSDPATDETYALTESNLPTLRYPVWRPDGQRILITARGTAIGSLIEIDLATRTERVLTAPDEDVRYGVYGPRPGSYVAVVGGSGEGRELIQFENDGGSETSRLVLARDVGRIDYDRSDSTVYFTKVSEAGLFKVDQKSGSETLVTRRINPAHLDGWLVLGGHVFYIEAKAKGPSRLHELDPVSGDDSIVASIPDSVADFNFSVSHDRREIVIVRIAAEDTDVGAVTLTHEGAG